jgi:hypothetical protein
MPGLRRADPPHHAGRQIDVLLSSMSAQIVFDRHCKKGHFQRMISAAESKGALN